MYLWDFPTLRRSKRCPLCRLVWKTFQPYYEALRPNHPDAVLGVTERLESTDPSDSLARLRRVYRPLPKLFIESQQNGRGAGFISHCRQQARTSSGEEKWISLVCMIARNTMDNRDMAGSGKVYIYEDERVPGYGIYTMANQSASSNSDWRLSYKVDADSINFDLLSLWITTCESEHGSKCQEPSDQDVPGRRLIDVEQGCIVEGSTACRYMALSYVWGSIM
jgi:hypothetical protein